ncbi:MAG: PAS domain-containing protein [Rhizobiales bacterium]|nr:PAS domain-containing protein [Hyphomicrobiales bacterium]
MALEVFNGTSIPRELATAAMEFLWAKWKTLHSINDLTLQRLTEECSYPLRANSVHLVSAGDDFVYTYYGQAMRDATGQSLAGTLVSENSNPLAAEFGNVYRQVAKKMTPTFVRFSGTHSRSGQLWQCLVLPIKLAHGGVMLVVYQEQISHNTEVYEQLFRTAPDAMVIACPIANDVGHVTDGWVTMMNDRARELLNFTGSIGNLRLNKLPQFAGVDLWARLYAPKSAVNFIDIPGFHVEIMRFPHVFGLKFRAKTVEEPDVTLVPETDFSALAET